MLGGKRGDLTISLDILRLVRKGERKTRIMYGANLSYDMLTRYLEFLRARGFIEEEPGRGYRLTPKGIHLIADLERVSRHFDETQTMAEPVVISTSPLAKSKVPP